MGTGTIQAETAKWRQGREGAGAVCEPPSPPDLEADSSSVTLTLGLGELFHLWTSLSLPANPGAFPPSVPASSRTWG